MTCLEAINAVEKLALTLGIRDKVELTPASGIQALSWLLSKYETPKLLQEEFFAKRISPETYFSQMAIIIQRAKEDRIMRGRARIDQCL